MVFHEITREAIHHAVESPRELDRRLVDAQETRRILDRLFGYEVSPVLWKLVRPKLSAGRVQSPAIRIVVDRERERMRFRAAAYWDVAGEFSVAAGTFGATLTGLGGVRIASGKDFDREGGISRGDVIVLDRAGADAAVADLAATEFSIRSVERKPYRRSPYPPFRTSTLQQEAGRKLRFSSQHTMRVAQKLYENGYITYMRTDSVSLSERAIAAARSQVIDLYGRDYVPAEPRVYVSKVKNAQEAHEAIRPAGDTFRTTDQVRSHLNRDEAALYDLVWKRTVASQMSDAVGESVQVRLGGAGASGRDAEFSSSGKVIAFPGFLRAYVEGTDDPDAELEDQERRLPQMAEGERAAADRLEVAGHETKPPARYTEASLVKRLEDLGIGRPSTYASIIQTIQDRGYVWKKGTALVPSFTAFSAVRLLEEHFTDLVDYGFTARMEEDLDEIADGQREMVPYLQAFYFGNGHAGLVDVVKGAFDKADPREINTLPFAGLEGVVLRSGRFGPYLERGEERVGVPEDIPPDELTPERAAELLDAPSADRELGADPVSGHPVLVRSGRFGPYVQLGHNGDKEKRPTASLFKSMSVDTVTLDQALRLLSLPRVVGHDPETGDEITAANGRYGPYVKRGGDTRSLQVEEELFTITLERALVVLAQPKTRRGQTVRGPLKDLGADPATGWHIVVRDGKFGPYVTDGGVNASLRREDSVERITADRASALLAERREKLEGEGKEAKPGKPPQ
jgi:DNA topoisomerase-1